jgi:hypothetical protein
MHFRPQIPSSGKGVEVELVLPYVPKPDDQDDRESVESSSSEDDVLDRKMSELKIENRKRKITKRVVEVAKSSLEAVECSFRAWYTIDTMRLLKGDDAVRQALRENECSVASIVSAVGDESYSPEFRASYTELCRKLDVIDLREDNDGQGDAEPSAVESADKLFKEVSEQNAKFSSYLMGKTEYDASQMDIVEKADDEVPEAVLPLLDKHAQGALRRKIVHDQLDRA